MSNPTNTPLRSITTLLYILVAAGLAFVAILLVAHFKVQHLRPYVLGELLLGYPCGFIRRGLMGFLIEKASQLSGAPPPGVAAVLVWASYALFYALLLFKLRHHTLWLLMLVLAPWGMLFYVNDYGSFGRKEIFLLLTYLLGLIAIKKAGGLSTMGGKIALALLLLLSTLIHEGFIFLGLPWLALYLQKVFGQNAPPPQSSYVKHWLKQPAIVLYALGALLVVVLVATTLSVSTTQIECLLSSLTSMAPNRAQDMELVQSVYWLQKPFAQHVQEATAHNIKDTAALWFWLKRIVPMVLLLAALCRAYYTPATLLRFARQHALWLVAIAGMLAIQLLIALDWGRFLHISFLYFITTMAFLKPPLYRGTTIFATFLIGAILASTLVAYPHLYSPEHPRKSVVKQYMLKLIKPK